MRERAAGRRLDLLIAGGILALGQVEIAFRELDGPPLAAHALWAAAAVAVLGRRRWPLLFFAWALVVQALCTTFELAPQASAAYNLYIPLGLFGLGAFVRDPRRAVLAACGGLLALTLVRLGLDLAGALSDRGADEWLRELGIYAPAAAGGVVLRDRTEALRAARERARRAAADEADAVDDALRAERTRIARELHAVVTRCVRAVLDEVGAARSPLAAASGTVSAALLRARVASQQALAEMRRMLVLLRSEPPPGGAPEDDAPAARVRPSAWQRIPSPLRAQGLPLLLAAIEVAEALLAHGKPAEFYGTATVPERVLGATLLALALVPRRRWPLASVLGVVAIVVVRSTVVDDAFGLNPPLYLAAFCAGAYVRPVWLGGLAALSTIAGGIAVVGIVSGWDLQTYPVYVLLFFATMTAAAWITGVGGRRRLAEAQELRELTAAEERRRERAIERTVNAERLRVARELHDLVGHGLTSITLQCAVAAQQLQTRPAAAAAAIDAVQEVGGEVLRELHQLLAALDGSREAEAPELARLPELARRARTQGLEVRLRLEGDLAAVPAGHVGAAYRIVQEALTNARKHGGAGVVQARVASGSGRVAIEVRNAAGARPAPIRGTPHGSGLGLAGMRERVRVYGGSLSAGPEGGAWVVRAELPLAAPLVAAG